MLSREAKDYIKKSFKKGKVVCLTGAGISAESGIPTFRGRGGLWEKYDPEIYANNDGLTSLFKREPQSLADFIVDFYSLLFKAHPNPGHLALFALEKEGILSSIITQNIDNLHQQAGSRNVIELHGNAYRIRCSSCLKSITLEKERLREMIELLRRKRDSRRQLLKVISRYFPLCGCGWRYRIDIVLFGEMLPEDELSRAYQRLKECSALLIVGSSLVVYPAASLPLYAKQRGAKLIEINNEPTAMSDLCDCQIKDRASKILPEIASLL